MSLRDSYFNISAAASYLGVTRQTVSRYIAQGIIPVERIGRVTLIDKKVIYEEADRHSSYVIHEAIVRLVTNMVRREFDLGKDDIVDFLVYGNGVFTFTVDRIDGTRQMVYVDAAGMRVDDELRLAIPVHSMKLENVKPKLRQGEFSSSTSEEGKPKTK